MFKKLTLVAMLLFLVFTLSACTINWPWQKKVINDDVGTELDINGSDQNSEASDSAYQIRKFASYEELKEFIDSIENAGSGYYGRSSFRSVNTRGLLVEDSFSSPGIDLFGAQEVSQGLSGSLSAGYQGSSEVSNDYSRTNIQVEGVDEADIIKTDGKYIYLLSKGELFIINAVPAAELDIISTISFDARRPVEIYLDGDRLVVISFGENLDHIVNVEDSRRSYSYHLDFAFVDIFDISNKKEPKNIRHLSFEGAYVNSRVIDGKLYLISNKEDFDEERILPLVFDGKTMLANDCTLSSQCYAPDVYYFNHDYNYYYTLTSINSIDIRGGGDILSSQAYLMNHENFNIYSSLNNLYLTYSDVMDIYAAMTAEIYKNLKPLVDSSTREALEKIELEYADDIERSNYESMEIITEYMYNQDEDREAWFEEEIIKVVKDFLTREASNIEKTVIHKLSLNEGRVSYEKSSSVSGQTLNQFSLDEDEYGNLRIATTNTMMGDFGDEDLGFPSSYSNLFVLSPSLETIGSITKIAENERIYSARFLGKRAYLVTFEIIDPLFVIDLSNPSKPELLGELKVPGYSTYLHPYDENTLIGLGRDTIVDEYGRVVEEGIKLSLFDVKDPTKPRELDTFTAGAAGSDSLALYNHKAFLFSKEKNLLLVPAFLRKMVNEKGDETNIGGAMIFSIDNYKFRIRNIIDHSDNGKSSERDRWCGDVCYDNTVQRGLYINDVIYTFSNQYLKANSLNDLQPVSSLILTSKSIEEGNVTTRDEKRVSDVKQIQAAMEMYYNDMNHYPPAGEVVPGKPVITDGGSAYGTMFLAAVPTPPVQVDGDNCPRIQPAYTYMSSGAKPQTYTINYCLGRNLNTIEGNRLQTATPAGIK